MLPLLHDFKHSWFDNNHFLYVIHTPGKLKIAATTADNKGARRPPILDNFPFAFQTHFFLGYVAKSFLMSFRL